MSDIEKALIDKGLTPKKFRRIELEVTYKNGDEFNISIWMSTLNKEIDNYIRSIDETVLIDNKDDIDFEKAIAKLKEGIDKFGETPEQTEKFNGFLNQKIKEYSDIDKFEIFRYISTAFV